MTRITTNYTNTALIRDMQRNYANYAKLTQQISSGYKINSITDDPKSINIINANREKNKIELYKGNIDFINNQIGEITDSIDFIISQTQRVKDLATFASNGVSGEANIEATQNELSNIIESIVSMANTKYNGAYIFSGTNLTTPAYEIEYDDNGEIQDIKYNGTPKDAEWQRKLEVADGQFKTFNVTGDEVFGELMSNLMEFKTALKSGDTQAMIDKFSNSIDKMAGVNSHFGTMYNQLEQTKDMHTTTQTNLEEYISGMRDIDLASAVGEWFNAQSSLEASMKLFSEFNSVSLLNYI